MGIENYPQNTKMEGGNEMRKEPAPEDVRKALKYLKLVGELLLKSQEKVRVATPKAFLWIPQIRSDMMDMEKAIAEPYVEQMKELLQGTDEPIPRNEEEVKALLQKLDTPEFEEKIRRKLQSAHGN